MNTQNQSNVKNAPIDEQTMKFIQFVCTCLDETQPLQQKTIKQIVCILGTDKVKKLLQETLSIEQSGGMKTLDNKQRRTPGGVFFFLCKRHYKHQLVSVFPPKPQKRAPQAQKNEKGSAA